MNWFKGKEAAAFVTITAEYIIVLAYIEGVRVLEEKHPAAEFQAVSDKILAYPDVTVLQVLRRVPGEVHEDYRAFDWIRDTYKRGVGGWRLAFSSVAASSVMPAKLSETPGYLAP